MAKKLEANKADTDVKIVAVDLQVILSDKQTSIYGRTCIDFYVVLIDSACSFFVNKFDMKLFFIRFFKCAFCLILLFFFIHFA